MRVGGVALLVFIRHKNIQMGTTADLCQLVVYMVLREVLSHIPTTSLIR